MLRGRCTIGPRVGIDIGRVIIAGDGPDTSFLRAKTVSEAASARPVDGAIEGVRRLVDWADGRVWLVSKCGPRVQVLTRAWLSENGFHEETGVPEENVRFCFRREDKAPIAQSLGLTHFIDDREDVLSFMRGVVPMRVLFGPQPWLPSEPGLLVAEDWGEVLSILGVLSETA